MRQRFHAALMGLALACAAQHDLSPAVAQTRAVVPRADGNTTTLLLYGAKDACGPLVVFSHGLGGGIAVRAALGEAFQAHGWSFVAMQHAESGPAALRRALVGGRPRDGLMREASRPEAHHARMLDVEAALAHTAGLCRSRTRVLMGHSMGAMTTLLEAGATARFGRFGSDRFDAYVAVSPQGVGYAFAEGAWNGVRKPMLMITGTADRGADGDWTTRLTAFEHLRSHHKRLAVIENATHMDLAGRADQMAQDLAALAVSFVTGSPVPRLSVPVVVKER